MPKKRTEKKYILALDQGTTSSRAILFDLGGREVNSFSVSLNVRYPQEAWVEQDAVEIWETQKLAVQKAVTGVKPEEIACIGITNQRETTIAWNRNTGEPLAPAIVWQCRRSAEICKRIKTEGLAEDIRERTGLLVDSYFSLTKILWLRENVSGLEAALQRDEVVFGTVDSWLLYQLTGASSDAVIATEPSNACRTMLFNVAQGDWDDELLARFSLRRESLPVIKDSSGDFGVTKLLGAPIRVSGMLGDQQAALLGHGCVAENSSKCTFGTGAFLLLNTGSSAISSEQGLLSSVAWSLAGSEVSYALEGSIFIAGALVQWLRDSLGIISSAEESEALAGSVPDSAGVCVVPAFVGLGAPYWDEAARGAILGLTRASSAAHIVRASLEAVAHQVADIFEMEAFGAVHELAIDGGMSRNKLFCQILADQLDVTVRVPGSAEMTALGAAKMAGIGAGLFAGATEASVCLQSLDSPVDEQSYQAQISELQRSAQRRRWKEAVSRIRSSN